jgi:trehalose synthase
MINHPRLITVEDYERFVDGGTIERILKKAQALRDLHVVRINSTLLWRGCCVYSSPFLTLLFNTPDIKTGWRVIRGSSDFFSIKKKMHNALYGI